MESGKTVRFDIGDNGMKGRTGFLVNYKRRYMWQCLCHDNMTCQRAEMGSDVIRAYAVLSLHQ